MGNYWLEISRGRQVGGENVGLLIRKLDRLGGEKITSSTVYAGKEGGKRPRASISKPRRREEGMVSVLQSPETPDLNHLQRETMRAPLKGLSRERSTTRARDRMESLRKGENGARANLEKSESREGNR